MKTRSGIEIQRIYGPDEAGEYPFTRGIHKNMYLGKLWTMRQYAGFGTPKETNQRFKYLLEQGQTGLSLALDLPTQLGIDADDPEAEGEVGKVGVSLGSLADMEELFAGIPLGNQSVLLRNVNDDATVMKALMQKLLLCRVKPYYIYQCDLISGSAHLRASVRKGLEIMEGLRGHTTGYAVPQYVIDAPGGGGKVPINPDYVLSHNAERVVIRNFEGKIFEYPEAANGTPLESPPREIEEPELLETA